MKTPARFSVALCMSLALGTGCNDDSFGPRYFVKLKAEPAQVAGMTTDIADLFGLKVVHQYDAVSEGFATNMPPFIAEEIANLDEVRYVREAPDRGWTPPEEEPVPIDAPGNAPPGVIAVGGPFTAGGGIEVAVVDTGVDSLHPDLRVIDEFDAVCKGNKNDCANGGDPQGHGTHVAGTIGAVKDGGVVGVAAGVPIHAVRVLNKNGSGSWTDIIAGLEYVLDHPEIRVVNMSLGGPGKPDANDELAEAIRRLQQAGVIVVIAAGNDGANTNGFVPAGYDLGVVVSAYNIDSDKFAGFSNFGTAVDITAPGTSVKSTFPGDSYASLDGTSMATPHVAGVAAIWAAFNPNGTPGDFRDELRRTGSSANGGSSHPEPFARLDKLVD